MKYYTRIYIIVHETNEQIKCYSNQQYLSRKRAMVAIRRDGRTLWGVWAAADKVGLIPGGVSVGTMSPSGIWGCVVPPSDGGVTGWGLNGTAILKKKKEEEDKN